MGTQRTLLSIFFGVAVLCFLTRPAPGEAACAHPAGSFGCEITIQDAVDATPAGGTVLIYPGTYTERVIVPADKDGLTLDGTSTPSLTILDGDVDPTTDTGLSALEIDAEDVTMKDFAVHNADDDGISVNAARARIENMLILSPDEDCIDVNSGGTGTVIVSNTCMFSGSQGDGGHGINIDSDFADANMTIQNNTIRSIERRGIDAKGHKITIQRNTFSETKDEAIYIEGDESNVQTNTIENCGGGIEIQGNDPVIWRNDLRGIGSQHGIQTTGDNPQITFNKVWWVKDDGIEIYCGGEAEACSGGRVANNEVKGVFNEDAYDINAMDSGGPSGVIVESNTAISATDDCFEINGAGIFVGYNSAHSCGDEQGEYGIEVPGTDNLIFSNEVQESYDDGIQINGDRNIVARNTCENNGRDGIDVASERQDIVLWQNTVLYNTHAGIEVSDTANNTTVGANTSIMNRVDFCDEGSSTVVFANFFQSTGDCYTVDSVGD